VCVFFCLLCFCSRCFSLWLFLKVHVLFVCYVLVSFISYFLFPLAVFKYKATFKVIRRGADKSLAFPISYFLICSTTK
jgi:hypothetical protein